MRALTGCLIAGVAIRCRASLLHADSDFKAIARHALAPARLTQLQLPLREAPLDTPAP